MTIADDKRRNPLKVFARGTSFLSAPAVRTRPQVIPSGQEVHAPHWGITRAQLADLLADCTSSPQWDAQDNVRTFVQKFVEPRTAGTWMGLSLVLNCNAPKAVNLMVSHSWEENAQAFFADVIREMHDHEVAFICFLAIYQGGGRAIEEQLGDMVVQGPFVQVIKEVFRQNGRMLVVPNETLRANGQGLYSRMWCDFEIYTALQLGCCVKFAQGTMLEHLFGSDGVVASQHARCGNPAMPMNSDERMIRNEIETMTVLPLEHRGVLWLASWIILHVGGTAINQCTWQICIKNSSSCVGSIGALVYYLAFVGLYPVSRPLKRAATIAAERAFEKLDGYEELDLCIRKAAHFSQDFPGKTMDPRTWKPKTRGETGSLYEIISKRRFVSLSPNFFGVLCQLVHLAIYLPFRWGRLRPLSSTGSCLEWSCSGPLGFAASRFLSRAWLLAESGTYGVHSTGGRWQALVDVALPLCCILGSACGSIRRDRFGSFLWGGTLLGLVLTLLASFKIAQIQPTRLSRRSL